MVNKRTLENPLFELILSKMDSLSVEITTVFGVPTVIEVLSCYEYHILSLRVYLVWTVLITKIRFWLPPFGSEYVSKKCLEPNLRVCNVFSYFGEELA